MNCGSARRKRTRKSFLWTCNYRTRRKDRSTKGAAPAPTSSTAETTRRVSIWSTSLLSPWLSQLWILDRRAWPSTCRTMGSSCIRKGAPKTNPALSTVSRWRRAVRHGAVASVHLSSTSMTTRRCRFWHKKMTAYRKKSKTSNQKNTVWNNNMRRISRKWNLCCSRNGSQDSLLHMRVQKCYASAATTRTYRKRWRRPLWFTRRISRFRKKTKHLLCN